jgi:hypothetical protein
VRAAVAAYREVIRLGVVALAATTPIVVFHSAPAFFASANRFVVAGQAGQHNETSAGTFENSSKPDAPVPPDLMPRFLDVSETSGLLFTFHSDINRERLFLPEIMGGGVAWLDFDLDGWLDVYLVNGGVLPTNSSNLNHCGELFRNRSGTTFAPIAEPAGLRVGFYGQGAAAADFDNDGFDDLYLTGFGRNYLFRNNGDGTISDETDSAGVRNRGWGSSCAFGDLDRDGILDMYVANYVATSLDDNPVCMYQEPTGKVRGYCGPIHYTGEPDVLYKGLGDGKFRDVTSSAGCSRGDRPEGKGLGVVIADVTNDGWPDIFVANDMMENFLFVNEGGSKFVDQAMARGVAFKGDGQPGASMGVACGDYNGDGRLDLYVTQYIREPNSLYQNTGDQFLDATASARLQVPTLAYLGFGTMFLDYDNDSWLDLFVANGHVLGPNVRPNEMRPQLFRNLGTGVFEEITNWAGPYFYNEFLGRGAASADYDNDGGVDVLVSHLDRPAALLRNETAPRGNCLGLELIGMRSNRSAIGARIEFEIQGRRIVRAVIGGGSYLSTDDRRLCIGTGAIRQVDKLMVRWPSGDTQEFRAIPCNHYWTIVEGRPWRAPGA